MAENQFLCIDNGSHTIKTNYAGEEQPFALIPSRLPDKTVIRHGVIEDWDTMEEIWGKILAQ